MRTLTTLALLAALAFGTTAQEAAPKKASLKAYGTPASQTVDDFRAQAGLGIELHEIVLDDLERNCVLTTESLSPDATAELLAFATGLPMRVEGERLIIGNQPGGTVKGYDVSVLAGTFVEYVNSYGAPKPPKQDKDKPKAELTAAERLAFVLESVLRRDDRPEMVPSVVGDRILFTLSNREHQRVRELLDLLMRDGGGESENLKGEREVNRALAGAEFSDDLTGTPAYSVIFAICRKADLNVVFGAGLADYGADLHIDFSVEQPISATDALQQVFDRLGREHIDVAATTRAGAVAIDYVDYLDWIGYRVYDIGDLLKRISSSYQRQRTARDKAEGFEGDIRQAGGNQVVYNALVDQLDAQDLHAFIETYGTKVVVRGSAEAVDAATDILKEMGWEPPEE